MGRFSGVGLILACAAMALLAGCARPPAMAPELAAPSVPAAPTAQFAAATAEVRVPTLMERLWPDDRLAGRTLVADTITDIMLEPGEVILTFDDGPRPGKTDR